MRNRLIVSLVLLLVACTVAGGQSTPAEITGSTLTPLVLGSYPLLLPEDMRADLDYLFQIFERNHPKLYAHRSKAEVDLDRQQIFDELDQPMTLVSYYMEIAPLVNSLGDSHTMVLLPPDAIDAKELFFPLEVEFQGQQAYITANYSGDDSIQLGAELLEVNGIPITTIRNNLTDLPVDHFFQLFLWFLFGSISEYQLNVLPPDAGNPVVYTVYGTTMETLRERISESPGYLVQEPLVYETLPDEKIGLLTINSFMGGPGQYLQPVFTQIREDDVQHLIIDIRSNNGGMYDQVDALMKYLTDQPYQHCSRRYVRFVVDVTTDPRQMECDLIQPLDIPLRFQGKLYLLVGPDTYSAAITFASILQDYDLAVLIGEETTDPASYCGYVEDPVALPRTHLLYQYPVTCYVRPNGVFDDRGVVPDVIVKTTLQDHLAGRDPIFSFTLETIRNQNQVP